MLERFSLLAVLLPAQMIPNVQCFGVKREPIDTLNVKEQPRFLKSNIQVTTIRRKRQSRSFVIVDGALQNGKKFAKIVSCVH